MSNVVDEYMPRYSSLIRVTKSVRETMILAQSVKNGIEQSIALTVAVLQKDDDDYGG